MIPFNLLHHSHGKHNNFRYNPLLPLHITFNLKKCYEKEICLAFRITSILFFPSPQFLPFPFTPQAELDVTTVTWYSQKPDCRAAPRIICFQFSGPRTPELREQHFVSEGMKI